MQNTVICLLLDNLHSDEWEGVHDFCQVLDNAIEFEIETELFEGKRVLEVRGYVKNKEFGFRLVSVRDFPPFLL